MSEPNDHMGDEFDQFITVLEDLAGGVEPEWEMNVRVTDNGSERHEDLVEETFETQYENMPEIVGIAIDNVDYVLNCTPRFKEELKAVLERQCAKQGVAGAFGMGMIVGDLEESLDAVDIATR